MSGGVDEWTAAMRGERYADAWALQAGALAARDPATRDDPTRPYHQRWVWDGTPVDGRDVLVRCYHGLGDTIQFARFLPLLARRARSVTVEAQPRLLPLLATLDAAVEWTAFDPARPLPPGEVDIEIGELDFVLRATPRDATAPYLSARRAVLPAGAVALCHGAGDWDAERSIAPELLTRVATARPCVTLMPGASPLPVLNPAGCPLDMEATASLVAGASLVITVDTMIAHLAGALGRPTWVLLKHAPDWRWNPVAQTTPWYPSLTLYPQTTPGQWGGVIDRVLDDLTRGLIVREQA